MILRNIDILNFKNIPSATMEFSPGVNCFLGMNGMGKSNLLEAIHFLSMARPMSALPDSALLKHGEESMMVKGVFLTDTGAEDIISCGIGSGKQKKMKRNGKEYKKLSEHIGRYPIVSVTPNDSRLVNGAAEERRKLMDMVISQADAGYLASLIRYTKALESRNRMLRAGIRDNLLYESVENTMSEAASSIYESRKEWIMRMAPETESVYASLAATGEKIEMRYKSQLEGTTLKQLLDSRRVKDTALGFTSAGPHRDDMEITLNGYNLRNLGSQGQVKTFTIALRLAIFRFLREVKGTMPLLLLDDIFDKLDASRVENIMREVSTEDSFGQIFITDTNRKHLDDILAGLQGDNTLINVKDGEFTPITR